MSNTLRKPRATSAPVMNGSRSIDNLLRRMQLGYNYDPLVELMAIARSTKSSVAEKIKIAQELMSYVYPKVKAIATDPNMGDVINITVQYDDKESAKSLESSLPPPLSEDEVKKRRGQETSEFNILTFD